MVKACTNNGKGKDKRSFNREVHLNRVSSIHGHRNPMEFSFPETPQSLITSEDSLAIKCPSGGWALHRHPEESWK
ncbi:predicted protein [Botrytis cinerea T4]|uniref:Uncharacterized protein n=1 Tax=Botryotinia fuckeliana (strain T4) TaxID=999810 RepID=G2YHX7_BOTF4|nr:predicted protein [Botrytis cinerea T4]